MNSLNASEARGGPTDTSTTSSDSEVKGLVVGTTPTATHAAPRSSDSQRERINETASDLSTGGP